MNKAAAKNSATAGNTAAGKAAKGRPVMIVKSHATYKAGPYKGYFGHAEWDADEGFFYGGVIGTRDVITFQGDTIAELNKAFCESVDDYLDMCKKSGRPADRPFSGKFVVRLPAELHQRAAGLAEQHGTSLNALVAGLIERAASEGPSTKTRKTGARQ
jgi:predicted HicB family RNase H-like nuclease